MGSISPAPLITIQLARPHGEAETKGQSLLAHRELPNSPLFALPPSLEDALCTALISMPWWGWLGGSGQAPKEVTPLPGSQG